MAFKFNVSHKGRTFKAETDNESFIRMKIGDKINGNMISADLDGYELEITGTSDVAGFPGIKGEIGSQLRGRLLTSREKGMKNQKHDGLRLKKSVRGEEISEKTIQINTKVLKEGAKKFDEICPAKPKKEEEPKTEEAKEEPKQEAPKVEEKKEEVKAEAAPAQEAPKAEEAKEEPKQEAAPAQEEPKAEEAKEEPKQEEAPKVEEKKEEAPAEEKKE